MLVFTIGEFSKVTGLTIKTLRFYHEEGLLPPTCVDEPSGYRYYDASKIELARAISFLRELEFSLDDIRAILRECGDDSDLLEAMARQRGVIEEKIRRYRKLARSLDDFLTEEKRARLVMTQAKFDVEKRDLDSLRVAGIRRKGRYAECGDRFGQIARRFGRWIRGKPLMLHYDSEYRENDADFEAGFPVAGGQPTDGIALHDVAGGPGFALLHKGPYDQLGRSYAKILAHIKAHGFEVRLPTREVYIKGPGMIFRGHPKNYLTEIQMLVQPAESGRV
jgi:DNA-binding transcriptional MerR regulator